MAHIYKVVFKNTGEERYFTSLAAIYTRFTTEQIGVPLTSLYNLGVRRGQPYRSLICDITQHELISKHQEDNKQD